ncbi:MAG TPA: hypothetical protein VLA21_00375 [Candidatus Limnocylindria bacterium]|nr:hypothetical protein [Candidatus Limnocylindria bacterium]
MTQPERLKQAAEDTLGGLVAGPALLNRARMKAAGKGTPQPRPRLAAVRAVALAMALVLVAGVTALTLPGLIGGGVPLVRTMPAGDAGPAAFRSTARDVPRGSLILSTDPIPPYQGVWAAGDGANFPLIRHDGRYYRMLTHPQDASALLGERVGEVAVFTREPALDAGGATLSNAVPQGTAVYRAQGLGRAALAAQVGAEVRLFQRVSFAGTALAGNETLEDTLPRGASALQLSGVGTVNDPGEAARLMDLLYATAVYTGSAGRETGQALLVQYPSGAVLQLAVSGDSLSAAGTWSGPEFLEALRAAAQ